MPEGRLSRGFPLSRLLTGDYLGQHVDHRIVLFLDGVALLGKSIDQLFVGGQCGNVPLNCGSFFFRTILQPSNYLVFVSISGIQFGDLAGVFANGRLVSRYGIDSGQTGGICFSKLFLKSLDSICGDPSRFL